MSKIRIYVIRGSILTLIAILFWAFSPTDRYFEIAKNLEIFATLYKEVNKLYVDEVNPNRLMREGIEHMLESLDPYTNYIPEDDIEDFRTMTTGQYGGIGAIIGSRGKKNLIIMPYEGFPAHKAGLRIGDEIIKIDGIDVEAKKYSDISKLLKGQANTEVSMVVRRYGADDPLEFKLMREKITISNVPYHSMVDDSVGYLKLSDFTTGASLEVKEALLDLKKQGAKKIILDLRGNPGGLLIEAVNVSNIFIPKEKEVVSTRGKVKEWNKTYSTTNVPVDIDIDLAVLTNSRSASAAEIVSGVMQDYDRAVLVGQRTFGKGLVQATRPLSYNSQLKVTTAKYYTPSGRCIQAIDYTHRNEDGSVGKVPDSLKVAYKTSKGRVVYDGGGIAADIVVKEREIAPITISLINKNVIFNYATVFHFNHKEITEARDFILSDEQYTQFTDWVNEQDFDYITEAETSLEKFMATLESEKVYPELEDQLKSIEKKIHHNKSADFITYKEEIKYILESEIASRYYLEKGAVENSFRYDQDVIEAVKVLKDEEQYKSILKRN